MKGGMRMIKDMGHAQKVHGLRTDWLKSILKIDFPVIGRNKLTTEISEKEGSCGLLKGYTTESALETAETQKRPQKWVKWETMRTPRRDIPKLKRRR